MSLKIDTNQSVVAYHIADGAVTFNYAVDARHAVSAHPNEWSMTPWSNEDAEAARAKLRDQGRPVPEPEPLSPEDQAALDEHNAAVAAAAERLAAYRQKKAEEQAAADQAAQDEAIIASAPPKPDPTIRRPFGRTGEPTPAELEQIRKREAEKAERERIQKEKADLDKGAGVKITE
jgi:hypothetical protein